MRFLSLLVTVALAALGSARSVHEETAPPAFVNVTPHDSADSSSSTDPPIYPMLKLWTEKGRKGRYWELDSHMVQYHTCMTWLYADEVGGISSFESYKHKQGLPYYCLNYWTKDCTGPTRWWKGVIRCDWLDPEWDDVIHSTRCHHGRGPDDWSDPPNNGFNSQTLDGSNAQENATFVAPDTDAHSEQ